MNLKINQICRENVQLCHGTEYILIDDFFDVDSFTKLHNEFLLDYTITNDKLDHYSLSRHPLMDILLKNEDALLAAINNVWNEMCVENKSCVSLLPASNTLPIHNDTHWKTIPIRGVLYLDEVCGTTFHSDSDGSNPIEVGGKSNQLLLFKVTDKSFHSVGLYNHNKKDRFAISMMFDKVKD